MYKGLTGDAGGSPASDRHGQHTGHNRYIRV